MAKRSVKSLNRSGRVSRSKARSVAKNLRQELESGKITVVPSERIVKETTASGRSAIAFHVASPSTSKKSSGSRNRKAARKAAR